MGDIHTQTHKDIQTDRISKNIQQSTAKVIKMQTDTSKYFHQIVTTFTPDIQKGFSVIMYDTIRYDTRCYFNVRSKADMSQLNLIPHGNDN